MNIDIPSKQEIIGDFIDTNGNTLIANVKVQLIFNRYNPIETKIFADDIDLSNVNKYNHDFVFRESDGTMYMVNLSLSTIFFQNAECYVDKIITKAINKASSFIYTSGNVTGLLYFRDIKSDKLEIIQYRVPQEVSEEDRYYYEIKSNSPLDEEEIDLLFLMLSTITASKFFCISSLLSDGQLTFYARWAHQRRILIYGSGRLLYPIEMKELMEIGKNVPPDYLRDVLLLYTDFCTTKGLFEQLIKGCNLIDYIIENYHASRGNQSLGKNKTEQLFKLLQVITVNNVPLQNYIKQLFIDYPMDIDQLKGKKFEFLERRDSHIHRGVYLSGREQMLNLLQNIFVINELLRIIILHLPQIPYKTLEGKEIIHISKMEDAIEFRRRTINSHW